MIWGQKLTSWPLMNHFLHMLSDFINLYLQQNLWYYPTRNQEYSVSPNNAIRSFMKEPWKHYVLSGNFFALAQQFISIEHFYIKCHVSGSAGRHIHKQCCQISFTAFLYAIALFSAEWYLLVTMAVPVSISGNYKSPFFVFARKNYRDYFNARVPDSSTEFANRSVWITGDNFALYMEHFIKHTRFTEDKPG